MKSEPKHPYYTIISDGNGNTDIQSRRDCLASILRELRARRRKTAAVISFLFSI